MTNTNPAPFIATRIDIADQAPTATTWPEGFTPTIIAAVESGRITYRRATEIVARRAKADL